MPLTALPKSLVRLAAPAILACVTAASVWAPAAGATPWTAHATPPKHRASASRTKASTRSVASKRVASRRVKSETPSAPILPDVSALPTLAELLAGRGAAAEAGAESPLVAFLAESDVPAAPRREGPLAAFSAGAARLLSSMVDRARSQLGTRYVFGGERPGQGLDCSSFARFAMEALGITLPRTAAQQARIGQPVPRDRAKLLPGDLLTFGRGSTVSHVGIYLGEGRFIHASVTSHKIIETTIDRNPLLFKRWQGARRLIAIDDSASKHGDG